MPYASPTARVCLLIAALALSGCAFATVQHPIGRPATPEDAPNLDGVWGHREGVAHVKLLDDGELRVGLLYWDGEQFVLQEHALLLSVHDEALYLLHENERTSAPGEPRYTFMRILQPDEDSLVLLPADVSSFRDAVEAGTIPGDLERLESSAARGDQAPAQTSNAPADSRASRGPLHIRIDADAPTLRSFFTPERVGEQFRLDRATVLHRVGTLQTDMDDTDVQPEGQSQREDSQTN